MKDEYCETNLVTNTHSINLWNYIMIETFNNMKCKEDC